jgi:hypothetical protein
MPSIPNLADMPTEALEALESSIIAELQSRDMEYDNIMNRGFLALRNRRWA